MKKDKLNHEVCFCFSCANIFYKVKAERSIACPCCGENIKSSLYKKYLNDARNVAYYGYEYREEYEKQFEKNGDITVKYLLNDVSPIIKFITVAAISGVIGGFSYDVFKKVCKIIAKKASEFPNNIDRKELKNLDIQKMWNYTTDFYEDFNSAKPLIKKAIEEEIHVDISGKILFPASRILSGNKSSKEEAEKLEQKFINALKAVREKPQKESFENFWKNIK
ncbi:MAG: hypothetical protein ACYDFU_06980 [Nitrospirota bacterium]